METPQVGKKLSFNTGRHYSPDGQPIEAEIVAVSGDPELFPDLHVKVVDTARHMKIEVVVDDFSQDAIMKAYDEGNYKNI